MSFDSMDSMNALDDSGVFESFGFVSHKRSIQEQARDLDLVMRGLNGAGAIAHTVDRLIACGVEVDHVCAEKWRKVDGIKVRFVDISISINNAELIGNVLMFQQIDKVNKHHNKTAAGTMGVSGDDQREIKRRLGWREYEQAWK